MDLIKDQNQLDEFLKFIPELKDDEVYFISLSARNKYLTMEERQHYSLGRTEMFARNIIRKSEDFKYTISKLESTLHYKLTNNGLKVPEKCLVVYLNINPSSTTKAFFKFQNEMNRQVAEITEALKGNKQPNYSYMKIIDRVLMNSIQTSPSKKYIIDIDCDTKDKKVKEFIVNNFVENGLTEFGIIETHGGFHFLIHKENIPKKQQGSVTRSFNLLKICQDAEKMSNGKEVMINGNGMVPLPGTETNGHINKFTKIEMVNL